MKYFLTFLFSAFLSTLHAQTLKEVYKNYFPIGVAVAPRMMDDNAETALILTHFGSMTAENAMKMGPIHPEENRYNWTPADKIADFAVKNNLKLRGHTLCWHQQTPSWFFTKEGAEVSKEELLSRLQRHITDVVTRYKGKIYAWDVVNEAIPDGDGAEVYRKTKFYDIIGEEYIEKAFRWAHEADPNALLFYNDYNTEHPIKRDKIYQLLKKLKEKGVPIHGVGLQAHWSIFEPTAAAIEESIVKLAGLGLQVQFTELDVSVYAKNQPRTDKPFEGVATFDPSMEQKQMEQYRMMFEVFRKHKDKITGVTFWNLSDKTSWLDNFPVRGRKDFPLLFDQNYQPKKAFFSVVAFAASPSLVADGATLQKVSDQFKFTEGPAVDKKGNIYFTDQPNDRIWKYDTEGKLSLFMSKTGRSNGLYLDKKGNIIACADSNNQLWSISQKGKVTLLLDHHQNRRFNGPNDLWITPNSGIYFTDPYYQRNYWSRQKPDIEKQNVYFLPKGKTEAIVVDADLVQPNGIVGTPDGKHLFVADIRAQKTYKYDIQPDGSLANRQLFVAQGSDGITLDERGNLYITGRGVTIYDKKGVLIQKIPVPSGWTANLCFGGKDRRTLFITASESVYTLQMAVKGVE